MQPSPQNDASPVKGEAGWLNVEVVDELARKRGYTSVEGLARACGLSRSHMFNLRSHKAVASVPVGLRIARKLQTTVEKIFSASAS